MTGASTSRVRHRQARDKHWLVVDKKALLCCTCSRKVPARKAETQFINKAAGSSVNRRQAMDKRWFAI
jgi:hypothetical protein